jgi:hypothetical protein
MSCWPFSPTSLLSKNDATMTHHAAIQSSETMVFLRVEREERPTDPMQAAPMLGGLIYEAVMERNSMRARNDALRQTFTGGRIVLSPGVLSLPPQTNAEVLDRVRSFSAFDAENDPYHDFGRFDLAGVTYIFEVDCFARDIQASKDAIDTGKATRVLTIMRADEY